MRNPGNVEIHRVVRSAGLYTYVDNRIVRPRGNAVVAASLVLILAFFEPGWVGSNAFPQGTSPLRIARYRPMMPRASRLRAIVSGQTDRRMHDGQS